MKCLKATRETKNFLWRPKNAKWKNNFASVSGSVTHCGKEIYWHESCGDNQLSALDSRESINILIKVWSDGSQLVEKSWSAGLVSGTNWGLQSDLLVAILEHRTTAWEILRPRRNFQPGVQPGRVSFVGRVAVCASRRHARTNKSKNVKVSGLECRVARSRRPRSPVNAFLRLVRYPIASFGDRREQKQRSPVLSLLFRLQTDAVCAATSRGSGVKKQSSGIAWNWILWKCLLWP